MTNLVAKEVLSIGLHRAYNPGDLVDEETVAEHGWEDKVAAPDSREAQAALEPEPEYDPGAYGVKRVVEHLAEVSPEEREAIVAREVAGKNRPGIVGAL
jgi:hypothetical protein